MPPKTTYEYRHASLLWVILTACMVILHNKLLHGFNREKALLSSFTLNCRRSLAYPVCKVFPSFIFFLKSTQQRLVHVYASFHKWWIIKEGEIILLAVRIIKVDLSFATAWEAVGSKRRIPVLRARTTWKPATFRGQCRRMRKQLSIYICAMNSTKREQMSGFCINKIGGISQIV